MEPTELKKPSPAYVPHSTFLRMIGQIRELGHAPSAIDNTLLNGYSGSIRAQLVPAMRFVGLIDKDSRPLQPLKDIATAKDDSVAKAAMRKAIEATYEPIVRGIDLKITTPDELLKTFKDRTAYDGETLKRAVRFYVAAIKDVGIPFSSLLAKRLASTPRKPRSPGGRVPAVTPRADTPAGSSPSTPPPRDGFKRFAVPHDGEDIGVIEHPVPLTVEWCESASRTLEFMKGNARKPK